MADSDYVPLMFQAQVKGRSLIHKLEDLRDSDRTQQQAYDWADQWQNSCDTDSVPSFSTHVRKSRPYPFTWRMVTNSGQDEGVIRPVVGERGWAYFPGSSMKGAFLRACRQLKIAQDRVKRYCGGEDKDKELHPGILRFHGGYPSNDAWLDDSMVDIIHPQENWQANGTRLSHETPKVQISLYQPTFVFGISSTETLPDTEWTEIWRIWDKALERGIGSRVSAGYGQIKAHGDSRLLPVHLFGQGATSRRIDKEGEFRPNIFKAALRGHTRRLFQGVTDVATADKLTKQLWGGIGKGESATVGLLGVAFDAPDLDLDEWVAVGNRNNRVPTYDTGQARLDILLMDDCLSPEQQKELKSYVISLVKFSMLVGGFGKSWRRADHRLFMPDYRRQMIGCHWEFTPRSKSLYIPTKDNLLGIQRFLETFHQKTQMFSWLTAITDRKAPSKIWKEAWCKGNVQVWGRIAEDDDDSLAINWFHRQNQQPYIKQSDLTGSMNRIGRIWHRLYPRYLPPASERATPEKTDQLVELLTIFPNRSGNQEEVQKTTDFLRFLDQSTSFKQLW